LVVLELELAARHDHDLLGHRLGPWCGGPHLDDSHHVAGGETGAEIQGDLHDFSLRACPLCGKDGLLTIPATTEPAYDARMGTG
jgi:hypothetical protein